VIVRWWFVRLVVVLAVLAVVAFDGISIMITHFTASDDANHVAQVAANAYHDSNDTNRNAAVLAAEQALPTGASIVPGSVSFAPDGAVNLQVRRTAKSLFLHVLEQTRSWAVVTESGSANPPS
jgi:hypothetical protein